MEMSQGGFSAFFNAKDTLVFGAIGAYDWSGGIFEHKNEEVTFINMSRAHTDMRDSYLGYSVGGAHLKGRLLYFMGAPRFQHRGKVIVFSRNTSELAWEPVQQLEGEQIGSYFGSELCVVDLDEDSVSDLLLIGAPLYHTRETGGLVLVCQIRSEGTVHCGERLQGKSGYPFARFGAAIAEIRDISGDRISDVAVGAPMENDQQGAVYLFHGTRSGILSKYSQRIKGSEFGLGLKYFGQSLHGLLDISGDAIPDIAVGAFEKVLLLRSRPVLSVEPSITFKPEKIPLESFECSNVASRQVLASTVTICFRISKTTQDTISGLSAILTYSLQLTSMRRKKRAVFPSKEHTLNETLSVGLGEKCETYQIILPDCVEDSISPIKLEMDLMLTGLPIPSANNLKPILNEYSKTQLSRELPFEQNCGIDDICEDYLKVSFNFSGFSSLDVGISPVLNLTVLVQNLKEDSYNTKVNLFFPSGLSYRKATVLQSNARSHISCLSPVSSEQVTLRNISCPINSPIFRGGARVVFLVMFDVSKDTPWEQTLQITASATSNNTQRISNESSYTGTIPVKFAVSLIITRVKESTQYVNFSVQEKDTRKTVVHIYQVENLNVRSVPVRVIFKIPVGLGSFKEVWNVSRVISTTGVPCQVIQERNGNSIDGIKQMKRRATLDCRIALCKEVWCIVSAVHKSKSHSFRIEGDLFSSWISQMGLKKLSLLSMAAIEFDEDRFVQSFWPADQFVRTEAETEIEVYEKYDYLPVTLGSSIGGLVLLALISAALYKAGFFNRQYKALMKEEEPGKEGVALDPNAEGAKTE
ncbi:integrin alpha-D [Latimeria chalumnae]